MSLFVCSEAIESKPVFVKCAKSGYTVVPVGGNVYLFTVTLTRVMVGRLTTMMVGTLTRVMVSTLTRVMIATLTTMMDSILTT